jgi:hypothetical protein
MGAAVHQSGEYTNRFYAISFHVPRPGDQSSICSDKQINSCCAQSDQLAQNAVQSRFFIPVDCLARSSFELRTWVAVDQIEGFCRLG